MTELAIVNRNKSFQKQQWIKTILGEVAEIFGSMNI
jgi:hypothetical protein